MSFPSVSYASCVRPATSLDLFRARLTAVVRVRCTQVTEHKRARREQFKQETSAILENFPALRSGKVCKVYQLQRNELKGMFEKISRHIVRKRAVMDAWADGVNREHDLIVEIRNGTNPAREVEIVAELEKLQQEEKCLAFQHKPDQQEYIKACSYSDVWVKQYNSFGDIVGIVASYYICLGKFNDQTDCLMLIPSKDWDRANVDPIACKKWFCTSKRHWKRYKAGWGQIVVIKQFTQFTWKTYYMRASVPGWDKEDIRAMDIEARLGRDAGTPMQVYDGLERLVPATDELVVPADKANWDSVRLRSRADLDAMQWFPWNQIYNMVGHEPATASAKRDGARVH